LPGAPGKLLCPGWDVSAHHQVLYKELGLACEAGLGSWGCRYWCPSSYYCWQVCSPATSVVPGYLVVSKTCTPKK